MKERIHIILTKKELADLDKKVKKQYGEVSRYRSLFVRLAIKEYCNG